MRRATGIGAALLLTAALAGSVGAAAGPAWKAPPFQTIGIQQVGLGYDQLAAPTMIRTFIPTGSSSGNCLISLNEANMGPWPITLICSARAQVVDGEIEPGLMIHISLPAPGTENPDYGIVVSLYQEGAKYYGEPVPVID